MHGKAETIHNLHSPKKIWADATNTINNSERNRELALGCEQESWGEKMGMRNRETETERKREREGESRRESGKETDSIKYTQQSDTLAGMVDVMNQPQIKIILAPPEKLQKNTTTIQTH